MVEFGKIKNLDLREIWQNEAKYFTPWLSENITILSEELEMDLEIQKTEAVVGSFSLDLLAKDLSSNKTVIIENQLENTNHDHLGKLLTYASGYDAEIIIWISKEIRDEHRQTLDWLNRISDTKIGFFGVEVKVFKIDESKPVVRFNLVSSPTEWNPPTSSESDKMKKYRGFFQKLIDDLREVHKFTNARSGQPQNWFNFPSGISGLVYAVNFCKDARLRTEIYIDFGDKDKNKALFDHLKDHFQNNKVNINETLEWERLDNKKACRISIYRDGKIDDNEDDLEEYRKWAIERLLKLKKVFTPLLKKRFKA